MAYAILALFGLMLIGWLFKRGPDALREDARDWIIIDGSNVMYWNDAPPTLAPVLEAVTMLRDQGYTPQVLFDANAGHLVAGRYRDDAYFARMLGLPEQQVVVVGKGVQADPHVLETARVLKARVVSNDRFRDWAKRFPEVRKRAHLVHGGYHKGKLWMDFDGSRPRAGRRR